MFADGPARSQCLAKECERSCELPLFPIRGPGLSQRTWPNQGLQRPLARNGRFAADLDLYHHCNYTVACVEILMIACVCTIHGHLILGCDDEMIWDNMT